MAYHPKLQQYLYLSVCSCRECFQVISFYIQTADLTEYSTTHYVDRSSLQYGCPGKGTHSYEVNSNTPCFWHSTNVQQF